MRATAFPTTTAPAEFDSVEAERATVKRPASSPVVAGPILCGTDFSSSADAAVEVAAEFARQVRAPLALAHAVDMPRTLARDVKASRWLIASRKRTLRAAVTSLRATGLEVMESLRAGRPDTTLVQVATDENAQLIVMSAAERRRALDRLRGNVAQRTAARARTPLLMVREAEPLRAWLRGKRPLKVFVAYNFTTTADAALRWVKQLSRAGLCEVVLGYVNQPVDDYVRIGGRGRLPFGENPSDVLAVLKRDMKARARTLLGDIPVRCRVEPDVARTNVRLAEMAREEGADLLVAGSRQYTGPKRLWHGSVARALLSEATISVAIVPLATGNVGHAVRIPATRHVLVATDFSALGNAAIPHALAFLPQGGVLTLMHVASDSPRLADQRRRDYGPDVRLSLSAIRSISNRLRKLVPADAADRGILAQFEVVAAADVGQAISQAAERLGVDAICLGSDSRTEVGRAFLGSVTRTVRSLTRRPLLLVPAARM